MCCRHKVDDTPGRVGFLPPARLRICLKDGNRGWYFETNNQRGKRDMKIKFTLSMIGVLVIAAMAYGALDTYLATRTTILTPTVTICTSGTLAATTNSAVDCIGYKQRGAFMLGVAAHAKSKNTNFVANIKLQHAAASTGPWADISSATTSITGTNSQSAIDTVEVNFQELKRYVRAIYYAANAQGVTTNDLYVSFSATLDGYK